MFKKFILFLFIAASISACQEKTGVKPSMALFAEQETDVEPYKTRIIVNNDYMRMDDGENSNDFVLLDRKTKIIYSANSDNNTIMTVAARKVDVESPMKLSMSNDKVATSEKVPTIDGKTPEHYGFSVNGVVCYEAMLVKGMLPDMVKAMQTFADILAGDSAITLSVMPADMHNACDLAGSTFAPSRHLKFGFPVQEWKQGYSRTLLEYKEDYVIDSKLFELPKDYYQFSVQDFREGKVKLPE